jgi:predicted nucleic acid-binding protein
MLKVVFDTNVIVSAALYEKSFPALLLSFCIINVKEAPSLSPLDNP